VCAIVGLDRLTWLLPASAAIVTVACGVVTNFATDHGAGPLAWVMLAVIAVIASVMAVLIYRKEHGDHAGSMSRSADSRSPTVVGISIAAIVCSVGVVIVSVIAGGGDNLRGGGGNLNNLRVIQEVESYELVSSSAFCPTGDKVDLDTAKSGHGGQPQLGEFLGKCETDGGLAELILEDDRIHTPNGQSLLLPMEHGTVVDDAQCPAVVRQDTSYFISSVSLRDLQAGDYLCVTTDQGNIARVRFDGVDLSFGGKARVVVSYTAWRE
jgi:hypothetical protein